MMDLVFLIFGAYVGAFLSWKITESLTRKSAIEAGVAYWTIDAKTGETKFVWGKP